MKNHRIRRGITLLVVLLSCVCLSAQSVFRPLVATAGKTTDLAAGYSTDAPLELQLLTDGLKTATDFDAELPGPDGRPIPIFLERQPDQLGVALWFGTTHDPLFADQPHYRDVVFSYNPASGAAHLYGMTTKGGFDLQPAPGTGHHLLRVTAPLTHDETTCLPTPAFTPAKALREKMLMQEGCGEQRADGTYVVDMLFAYSHEAEFIIGDVVAHAVAQAATVTSGLNNSLIDSLEIRVVDVSVKDANVGVESSFLGQIRDYYGEDIDIAGADMYSAYQEGGGGWGSVPGQRSVNGASSPTAFRHEWGHNAGSSHCDPGIRPYAAGFDNGAVKTHMCGNNINYYSTPDIVVSGAPIGDAATADNSRLIRERRGILSGYARHLIPYGPADDGNCAAPLAAGRYHLRNVASGNYLMVNGTTSGSKLYQAAGNSDDRTLWNLVSYGDGRVMLYGGTGTRAMDVFGGSTSAGHNVGIWRPTGNNNQRFTLTETDNGTYTITQFSGLCLQVPAGELADGDEVHQGSCVSAGNRGEWEFVAVNDGQPVIDPSLALSNVTCSNLSTGVAELTFPGANGTTTYEWSGGETTPNLQNLAAGSYRVRINHEGIDYYHEGTVRTAAPLIASVTITPSYNSQSAGRVTVTAVANATPPLTYAWSDGGSGAVRTDLPLGISTVTITDANGCTEERPVRILQAPDPASSYVLQRVATGEYLAPTQRDAWWTAESPLGFTTCATDAHAYSIPSINGRTFWLENDLSDWRLRATDNGEIREWWSQNLTAQRWYLDWTGDDTFTLRLELDGGPVYATTSTTAASALVTTTTATDATEFRLVPIPDCPTAGDACSDANNSTENDGVDLLCNCCGEPNDCFGVAGAAANGDGDADGDGSCLSDDCDDNDAAIFPGAFCDDGAAGNYGDALTTDCDCEGRPASCGGATLENVAIWGSATSRNDYPGSPSPNVLLDGNTDGTYNGGNGSVWHGGAGYTFVDIDLGATQFVRQLELHTRTDCCVDRLNGVYIFLSDVPFTGVSVGDAQATATYEYRVPTNYNSYDKVQLAPEMPARYVRIKESMGHPLNLAELLTFTCPQGIALPLDLLSFTGAAGDKTHDLHWTTEREEAFAGFTLQRSVDGRTFTDLTYVAARGGAQRTDYGYTDATPPAGSAFYRLRLEDRDGTTNFSLVIRLDRREDGLLVSPNPVAAGAELTVHRATDVAGRYELLDMTGRTVRRFTLPVGRTHGVPTAGLRAGVYVLRAAGMDRGVRVVVW